MTTAWFDIEAPSSADDRDLPTAQGRPAPGPAIVLQAADATLMVGLLSNSQWGSGVAVSDGEPGPKILQMTFTAPQGAFEVWMEYAASEGRPVALFVDGAKVMSAAAGHVTSGWMPADQAWQRQVSLSLLDGEHTIELRRVEGAFPHVRRMALIPVAAAVVSESAHAALERRIAGRATLTETDIDSVIRGVAPLLRNLYAARRSSDAVESLLIEISAAVTADVDTPQDRVGFSGPFNGQRQRQAIFNRLDAAFGFDVMIETGAYLGTTTEMLAGLGRPVFSCELARQYFLRTAVRLANFTNVEISNTDSRSFLRSLLSRGHEWQMPFFYLDAHWNDDLPLPQEIALIISHQQNFVIFVDDFHHPDPGYGYDRYTNGVEMTLEYLLPRLEPSLPLKFLVPSAPARAETGARRGTLIVVPQHLYDSHLSGEPSLMMAELP